MPRRSSGRVVDVGRRVVFVGGIGVLAAMVAGVVPGVGTVQAGGHCRPVPVKAKPRPGKSKRKKPPSMSARGKRKPGSRSRSRRAPLELTGKVNLNTGTSIDLQLLPGVGPRRARRIIAWRVRRRFKHIWDLRRVRGFGRKTLRRLAPYLTTKGKTTLAKRPPAPRK